MLGANELGGLNVIAAYTLALKDLHCSLLADLLDLRLKRDDQKV